MADDELDRAERRRFVTAFADVMHSDRPRRKKGYVLGAVVVIAVSAGVAVAVGATGPHGKPPAASGLVGLSRSATASPTPGRPTPSTAVTRLASARRSAGPASAQQNEPAPLAVGAPGAPSASPRSADSLAANPARSAPAPSSAKPSPTGTHTTGATSNSPESPATQPSAKCGTLLVGQALVLGESLTSCNGEYKLGLQSDGNLVLYQGATALWNSATNGSAAHDALMQGDGNLVLYTSAGLAVWDSGTNGNDGADLVVQNDGNAVIYTTSGTALWNTATNGK